MTYIRDLDSAPPPAREERRKFVDRRAGMTVDRKVLMGAAFGLGVLSCLNLWVSTRLYSSAAELSLIQERLENLSAFEKRMADKINLVNSGVQGQLDRLNETVGQRLDAATNLVGKVETAVADMKKVRPAPEPEVIAYTEPEAAPGDAPQASAPAARSVRRSDGPPRLSPAYVRVESPDGKLTYKKVR